MTKISTAHSGDEKCRNEHASNGHTRNEQGMNTAEYAVGTVACCGFACVLWAIQDWYSDVLQGLFGAALTGWVWPL